jgi:hypothetical protein
MTTPIKLHGVPEAIHAMRELPRRVRIRHLRIALNAGGGVLKSAATSLVPTQFGVLKKSLGVKVTIPDASYNAAHHGRPAYVVVGPRRRFARAFVSSKSGPKLLSDKKALKRVLGGGKVNARVPSRYAHLVEFGTKKHLVAATRGRVLSDGANTFGRKATVGARPKSFLRRAVTIAGAAAQNKVIAKLHEGIKSEAAALSRV